jgi:hypothetical protein
MDPSMCWEQVQNLRRSCVRTRRGGLSCQCPRPERCPEMTAVAYPTLNIKFDSAFKVCILVPREATNDIAVAVVTYHTHRYFECYANFSSIITKAYFYLTLQPIPTLLFTTHIVNEHGARTNYIHMTRPWT